MIPNLQATNPTLDPAAEALQKRASNSPHLSPREKRSKSLNNTAVSSIVLKKSQ
jgi:hypothetical protein